MKIEAGTEKRVFEFITELKDSDKIALLSHTDLDGIVSAIVTNKVIDAEIVDFLDYIDLNESTALRLKKKKVNKIILTDIYFKDSRFLGELEKFADILVIDHHPFLEDLNSRKTVFIKGEDGYSCGYFCYYLFSKVLDLEEIDWLVACSCISDFCHRKPEDWLRNVMEKYGDRLEYVGDYVRKSGKFWDLQYTLSLAIIYFHPDLKRVYLSIKDKFGHISDLGKFGKIILDEINLGIRKFQKNYEKFDKGYFFLFNPMYKVGSIVSNIISSLEREKAYVIVTPTTSYYKISVRHRGGKIHSGEFLAELLRGLKGASGGGHHGAAGGHFQDRDYGEIRKRLGLPSTTKNID